MTAVLSRDSRQAVDFLPQVTDFPLFAHCHSLFPQRKAARLSAKLAAPEVRHGAKYPPIRPFIGPHWAICLKIMKKALTKVRKYDNIYKHIFL